MNKRLLLSLVIMLCSIGMVWGASASQSWDGASGAHFFDEVTLDDSNTSATFTFVSQNGSTFDVENFGVYGFTVKLDGATATLPLSFSSRAWHTVTVTKSGNISTTIQAYVAHPASGQETMVKKITVQDAGDLRYWVSDEDRLYLKKLTVSGPLNGADMRILRFMVNHSLETLDMSNAEMVSGGGECGRYQYDVAGSYGDYSEMGSTYTADGVINYGQFYRASALKSIILPNSVTEVQKYAFASCPNLQNVVIGNNTAKIGEKAFRYCSALSTISFPASITKVGEDAFYECSNLTKVITEDVVAWAAITFETEWGITVATSNPLYYAHKLYTGSNSSQAVTKVTLPSGFKSVGNYAFAYNTSITSVTFPEGMTGIGARAFSGCTSLTRVIANGGLGSVGEGAFEDCSNINYVNTNNLPEWCKTNFSIGNEFEDCYAPNGQRAYGFNGEESYQLVYGRLVTSSPVRFSKALWVNDSKLTTLSIPEEITAIGSGAFSYCADITSVSFPANGILSNVGTMAFEECVAINRVNIGSIASWSAINFDSRSLYLGTSLIADPDYIGYYDTVQTLKDYFSANPVSFTGSLYYNNQQVSGEVVIPEGQTRIGGLSFLNCKDITSIILPSTINNVYGNAFMGCSSLELLRLHSQTPPTVSKYYVQENIWTGYLDYRYFPDELKQIPLQVPSETKSDYETAGGWKEFKEIVETEPETIDVTDISTLSDAIYADAATGQKGGNGTLTISLKNAQPTSAYSFDLVLPEGVTVDSYTLSSRHNGHAETMNHNTTTGVYSFDVLSLQSKDVTGSDGAIWTLKLNVSDEVAEGDYAVKILNAKYSLTSGSTAVVLPDVTSMLTIENDKQGDANGDETTGIDEVKRETTGDDRYYNLNGQHVTAPKKGLYIKNGKKVVVK